MIVEKSLIILVVIVNKLYTVVEFALLLFWSSFDDQALKILNIV